MKAMTIKKRMVTKEKMMNHSQIKKFQTQVATATGSRWPMFVTCASSSNPDLNEDWGKVRRLQNSSYRDSRIEKKIEKLLAEFGEMMQTVQDIGKTITIKIFSLPTENYRLRAPVDVVLEIYPDEVIASIPDLEIFGEGSNQMEAVADLKNELLDLIDIIDDHGPDRLGNGPKAWKRSLEMMVEPCR